MTFYAITAEHYNTAKNSEWYIVDDWADDLEHAALDYVETIVDPDGTFGTSLDHHRYHPVFIHSDVTNSTHLVMVSPDPIPGYKIETKILSDFGMEELMSELDLGSLSKIIPPNLV